MGPGVERSAGMVEGPRVASLSPMASAGTAAWGQARASLPAAAAGGNPGESTRESPAGVEPRPEGPRMPQPVALTSQAGKGDGGRQTGG
jgi:hypothetical protein